jgi:hypothetical protein
MDRAMGGLVVAAEHRVGEPADEIDHFLKDRLYSRLPTEIHHVWRSTVRQRCHSYSRVDSPAHSHGGSSAAGMVAIPSPRRAK